MEVETLAQPGAGPTAVIGCGVNGTETVRLLAALGWPTLVHDRDEARAAAIAEEHGARAVPLEEALRTPKRVEVDHDVVQTARATGISFGD